MIQDYVFNYTKVEFVESQITPQCISTSGGWLSIPHLVAHIRFICLDHFQTKISNLKSSPFSKSPACMQPTPATIHQFIVCFKCALKETCGKKSMALLGCVVFERQPPTSTSAVSVMSAWLSVISGKPGETVLPRRRSSWSSWELGRDCCNSTSQILPIYLLTFGVLNR